MKSITFLKPLQFELNTEKRELKQGDNLTGNLIVTNRSLDLNVAEIKVILMQANSKKLIENPPENWQILEEIVLDTNLNIKSGESKNYDLQIEVKSHYPISDKNGDLFLVYGTESIYENRGLVDFNLSSHEVIESFINTFKNKFGFKQNYIKNNKEFTEVKLSSPDSKKYKTLTAIIIKLILQNEVLKVDINFKIKALAGVEKKLKAKTNTRLVQLVFAKQDYYNAGGFVNRELFEMEIENALEQAKPKSLF